MGQRRAIVYWGLAALVTTALPALAHAGYGPTPTGVKLAAWAGRLHPLAVHFPIALLLVAAVAEWVPTGRCAARPMVALGAAGAVVAAGLGWLDAANIRILPEMKEGLFLHRWIGTAAAAISVACAVSSRINGPVAQLVYRITLIICAMLVAIGGHLGGELVYGEGYFAW